VNILVSLPYWQWQPVPKVRISPPAQHFGDEIHTDVWGPSPIATCQGHKYFATFTDDATRCTITYLLHTKDEVLEAYKSFKAWAITQGVTGSQNEASSYALWIRVSSGTGHMMCLIDSITVRLIDGCARDWWTWRLYLCCLIGIASLLLFLIVSESHVYGLMVAWYNLSVCMILLHI
jgi:hypothetical protein